MGHGGRRDGAGRPKGSRNRSTLEMMALAGEGETPIEFLCRVFRDDSKPLDVRLAAARAAAPYLHPRPAPMGPAVELSLPDDVSGGMSTLEGLRIAHDAVLRAVSRGEVTIDAAKALSAVLETQRRLIETVELEQRIATLEEGNHVDQS